MPGDRLLEQRIRERFARSKSGSDFTVHVQGGVATIEGRTTVPQRKGAATRMAHTAGAKTVVNRVQVSATPASAAGPRRVEVKPGAKTSR